MINTAFDAVKQTGKFFAAVGNAAISEGPGLAKQKASHMWSGGESALEAKRAVSKAAALKTSSAHGDHAVRKAISGSRQALDTLADQGVINKGNYLTKGDNITASGAKIDALQEQIGSHVAQEGFMGTGSKLLTARTGTGIAGRALGRDDRSLITGL